MFSVETSRISDIVANPPARAAMEARIPQIADYYGQVGGMTLTQVAPMSQGALTEEKLRDIQSAFDALAGAPPPAPPPPAPPAPVTALPGKFSVETSLIRDIAADARAKAAMEARIPQIADYYGQVGGLTLRRAAAVSQGALTADRLRDLQLAFNAL